ncbi:hypothetical protein BS50DRAFT_491187 [Corynespora cassiicola Philippines]|uniref:Calcium channel subunit Mid1 n=1 Tax=Corynespora cassiicola Philippines TaxID=1448308 RepID=A0A2T2NT97_CORCC|nr:hypothetical protein BS50DRAFT_491187 [Corynespora cassiicola Philippines]
MQLPKLSPLQSRLLASALASCAVVAIWISFQPRAFVYAAEVGFDVQDRQHSQQGDSIPRGDSSFEEAVSLSFLEGRDGMQEEGEEEGGVGYVPGFAYFDRGLVGRQQEDVTRLTGDEKASSRTIPGSVRYFVLERSQLGARDLSEARGAENASGGGMEEVEEGDNDEGEGLLGEAKEKRQQRGTRVWISANACRMPEPGSTAATGSAPQMTMYVSTSTDNQQPGPGRENNLAGEPIPFVGGYANFTLQTDSDVYIGVEAPDAQQGWEGMYEFEIAASTTDFYHGYNSSDPFLWMVDTDSESALFITPNLTMTNDSAAVSRWINATQNPFTMYAFPASQTWSPMNGLERSICGLRQQFNATMNFTVESFMTTKFGDNRPKAQFHVQGLQNGVTYYGFLAVNGTNEGLELPGIGTIRAGGEVFEQFNWTTKVEDSCQVLFDLEFCSDVAYAVPSSPDFKFDDAALKKVYEDQARGYWDAFSKSLAQVACDTTDTAKYSLARTCDDCKADYKAWLCSVLMPRCEDWSADDPWLMERNINARLADGSQPFAANRSTDPDFNKTKAMRTAYNSSRNPLIDEVIKPGPYKEVLPCEDLCFDIVRSCPAQLGFACPDWPHRNVTYGRRVDNDFLTCNFPGAVVKLNVDRGAGIRLGVGVGWVVGFAVAVGGLLV